MNSLTDAEASLTADASKKNSKILTTGFALFAMFFGAGNLVFPLFLGANAASYIVAAALTFLFVGVGTPLLGLISISLFQANYCDFFGRLGKIPAFLLISFIILILGPLSGAPRTEVITYQSLLPFLPGSLSNPIIFSMIFCMVTFICAYREAKVIDIIGYHITPVKLLCFSLLIVLSIILSGKIAPAPSSPSHIVYQAVAMGYGTMDMLAAFFFSSIAVRAIISRLPESDSSINKILTKRLLKSCGIAAILLGLIYLGFMLAAYYHSSQLQNLAPDQLIHEIARIVLGQYGALFVGICVSFACLATSVALADVTSTYLHEQVLLKKIPRPTCMLIVMCITFFMTQLGFRGIMAFAYPVLKAIYPALIMLCIVNILYKLYDFKYVKTPVFVTLVVSVFINVIY